MRNYIDIGINITAKLLLAFVIGLMVVGLYEQFSKPQKAEALTDNAITTDNSYDGPLPKWQEIPTVDLTIPTNTPVAEHTPITGVHYTKAKAFLEKHYPGSPLIANLQYFQLDTMKGRLALAIAGQEGGFGIKSTHYNSWGYFCTRNGKTSLDCGWTSWQQSITHYINIEGNHWLAKFNGSEESLDQFVGKGKYCASSCNTWIQGVWSFYNQL